MADANETGNPNTTGPNTTGSVGEDLKQRAREEAAAASNLTAEARDAAASVASTAREETVRRSEEFRDRAADQLQVFADAVRSASDELSEKEPGLVSDLVRQAARGLEQFSGSLRRTSPGHMLESVRAFGRENPVAFLAGTMLAGFALARFASSSDTHGPARPSGYGGGSSYPGGAASTSGSSSYGGSTPGGTGYPASSPGTSAGYPGGAASTSGSSYGGSTPGSTGYPASSPGASTGYPASASTGIPTSSSATGSSASDLDKLYGGSNSDRAGAPHPTGGL